MTINFTIKTLEKGDHACTMDPNKTVKELKDEMFNRIGVPVTQQRFIFCGQVMRDDAKLSEYGIADKAVHLVFSAPPLSPNAASDRNEHAYNILSDDEEFDNQFFDVDDQVEMTDWVPAAERASESGRRLLLLEEMVYQCDTFVHLLRETCPRLDSDEDLLPTEETLSRNSFDTFCTSYPAFGENQGEVKQMYELAEITRCIALLETKLYPFLMWYANYLDVDLSSVSEDFANSMQPVMHSVQETLHLLAHIHHCHSEVILNENLRNHARPPLEASASSRQGQGQSSQGQRESSQAQNSQGQSSQGQSSSNANSPDVVCQIETHTPLDGPAAVTNEQGQPRRRRSRVQRTSIVVTRNGSNLQPPQLIQSLIQAVISRAHPGRRPRPGANRPASNSTNATTASASNAAAPNTSTPNTSASNVFSAPDASNGSAAPSAPPAPIVLMREIPFSPNGPRNPPTSGDTSNTASNSNATQDEAENSASNRRGPNEGTSRSTANQPFNFRPRMLDRLFGSDNFSSDLRFGSHDENLGEFCFDPYLNCNNRFRNSTVPLGKDRPLEVDDDSDNCEVDESMDLAAKTQAWKQYIRNIRADRIRCPQQDFSTPLKKLWTFLCTTLTWMDMNQFFYGDVDIAMVRMRSVLQTFIRSEMDKLGTETSTLEMNLEEKKAYYCKYIDKVLEELATDITDLKTTLIIKEDFDFHSAIKFIIIEEVPLLFIDVLNSFCKEEDFASNTVARIKCIFKKIYWMLKVACVNPNEGIGKFNNHIKELADSLSPNLYILFRTSQDKNNWIVEEAMVKTEVKNEAAGSSTSQDITRSPASAKNAKNNLNTERKNAATRSSSQSTSTSTVLQNSANLSKLQINPVSSSEAARLTASQQKTTTPKTTAPAGATKSKFNTSFPEDWDAIVSEDAESSVVSQGPFSDAYLSNIPSKKRKLIETKQVGNPVENLEHVAREVAPDLSQAALESILTNKELQGSLKTTVQAAIRQRLSSDPDFDPNRYECATQVFGPLE